ncbi:MAG: glycosyltransferase [Candidatus Omnitrophica bacterium]|nr:glycosyltransferase [Candidatus Omnitrophota bacterium]
MEKKISVIIPVYNSQDTLEKCLESIFNVEYSNFEVIVVNDSSRDKSAEVAKRYPCRIINMSERRGPAFARDKGVLSAEGDIVAFLDSDCFVSRDWLAKINILLKPDVVGLGGPYEAGDGLSVFSKIFLTYIDPKGIFYTHPVDLPSLLGGNCAFWKAALLRARDKKELLYFKKVTSGEDTVMCCELSRFGRLVYDPALKVVHNKKCTLLSAIKKVVNLGYSGAIVTGICGNLLARERDRLYKSFVFLLSMLLFVLVFFIPAGFGWPAYLTFVIFYTLVLLPLIVLVHRKFSLGLWLIFFPPVVFFIDMFSFAGQIKRVFTIIKDKVAVFLWHINLVINLISRRTASKIFFFVTKGCNADCGFCFNKDKHSKDSKDLTLKEIEKLTKSIGFLPWLTVTGGEPFLREDVDRVCREFYLNCSTRFITIATNGILTAAIIDVVEKLLIDCRRLNLTIIVALDDLKDKHDLIKKVKGCYVKAADTLYRLKELKKRFKRLTISINTMLLEENAGRIEDILYYFSKNFEFDRQALNLLRQPPGVSKDPDLISIAKYYDLLKTANNRLRPRGEFLRNKSNEAFLNYCRQKSFKEFKDKKPQGLCLAARKFFVIDNQGSVFPCELRLENLGSLRQDGYDFKKIIRNKKTIQVANNIKSQNCYCQWPCAIVCNSLMNLGFYIYLMNRLTFYSCSRFARQEFIP